MVINALHVMRQPGHSGPDRPSTPAIFLDRDGVINENRADHVTSWDDFVPVRGALSGIRTLSALGLPIVVVTNQAIVGRGIVSQSALDALPEQMRSLMQRHGGRLDAVYACPHQSQDSCTCRKPRPGLFFTAAADLDLDLHRSYYIGDALTDVEAGQAAGCTTIVVRTGRGLTQTLGAKAQAYSGYYLVRDMRQAASFIVHDYRQRTGQRRLLSTVRLALQNVRTV